MVRCCCCRWKPSQLEVEDELPVFPAPRIELLETSAVKNVIESAPSSDGKLKRNNSFGSFESVRSSSSFVSISPSTFSGHSISTAVSSTCPVTPTIRGLTGENAAIYLATLDMLGDVEDLKEKNWKLCLKHTGGKKDQHPAKVMYKMDPGNRGFTMHIVTELPYNMVDLWAPRLEPDLWPLWHPLVVAQEFVGTPEKWTSVTNARQNVCFGLYKSEINARAYRWINDTEGFFLQRYTAVHEGEVGYVKSSHHRDLVEIAALTVCPTPETTRQIVMAHMKLPAKIPDKIQNLVFKVIAPKLVKKQNTSAAQVSDPKYAYKARVEDDSLGIYAELKQFSLLGHRGPERFYDPALLE